MYLGICKQTSKVYMRFYEGFIISIKINEKSNTLLAFNINVSWYM